MPSRKLHRQGGKQLLTMPQKTQAAPGSSEAQSDCGRGDTLPSHDEADPGFVGNVLDALNPQGVVVSLEEQKRFAGELFRSIRQRKAQALKWVRNRRNDDIIGLIQIARESGDLNETVWRCFLAVHFGRMSADGDEATIQSASKLLCAFRDEPYWTWQRVSTNRESLRTWLIQHRSELQTLAYGNHRKMEAKKPEIIWSVLESFLACADEFGGASGIISFDLPPQSDKAEVFDTLLKRLSSLWRFGRLGAFDFLGLLIDLKMLSADPVSCYLHGATGPLFGARKLWGKRPVKELDRFAAELANQLGVSPVALEDALCNWQK
jgi:Alpha-glutamyl/putrescinyl thymine pyrophosphorylase clade 3